MKTELKLHTPDELRVTLTVTCTVGELRKIREILEPASTYLWPMSELMDQIRRACRASEFVTEVTEEKEEE